MATTTETLIFDILYKDRAASEGLSKLGFTAHNAADDVSTLQRRLDDVSRKSVDARLGLKGDAEALARLDKIQARLTTLAARKYDVNVHPEGVARAAAEISALSLELDKLGKSGGSADVATKAVGSGGLAGPSGMGALIGAGAALSPVLLTLGVGLGGVAAAAYGVLEPIDKAAHKTGGLQANMKLLDPEQQMVARSIHGLGLQYDAFQKALKPEILGTFNTALGIAGNLMHDVQPVAQATGKAFNQFLGQFGATLQDENWRQFWAFMATTAPQDMQLVGKLVIDVSNDIAIIVPRLQGLAVATLQVTDAVTKLAGVTPKAQKAQANWIEQLPVAGSVVRNFTGDVQDIWHGIASLGSSSDKAAPAVHHLTMETAFQFLAMDEAAKKTDAQNHALVQQQIWAKAAAAEVQHDAQAVTNLTTALSKGLDPLLAYSGALIAQKNDAVSMNTALKASSGWIGLATQKQRDSFGAANTYIGDLEKTAQTALAAHAGIGQEITNLQNALPALEHAKSGSKLYWQEVRTLIGYLDRLRRERQIEEQIKITAAGAWHISTGQGQTPGSGGFPAPTGAAAGMMVRGGIPGRDSVVIRAMPGELVVPVPVVASGAVDHLRGRIPGFAAGGIVPDYAGSVGGLPPWMAHNETASVAQLTASVGSAMAAAFKSALGSIGGGALGGDAAANKALARSMFPWPASMWPSFDYLEMREAGYNRFARNPSSGAYGIPQALPESKLPFAGQSGGGSHAGAQLAWMFSYIAGRYGNPFAAAAHEASLNWYDNGGYLPVGASIAVNTTGKPERVGGGDVHYHISVATMPGGEAEAGRKIVNAIREFEKRAGSSWRR